MTNPLCSLLPKIKTLKMRDTIECECSMCHKMFHTTKRNILINIKRDQTTMYCSQKCVRAHIKNETRVNKECETCGIPISVLKSTLKKVKHSFCSQSCSAVYHNTHKTTGFRRSKLEEWIENQLTNLYPHLQILYNNKNTINSELDIYIPDLKLAFELNGIFHYEPIYGLNQLKQIQNNDTRKFQACLEQSIELCIIDSSKQNRFTTKSSQVYLDIITNIINVKISHP